MKEYPRLKEMGVLSPHQIVRYAVNSINNTDYLLIVYKRPKGSILPVSRTYEFPRKQRAIADREGGGNRNTILQSNPAFKEALEELKEIVSIKTSRKSITRAMENEVRHLEHEFALHIASLNSLIDDIKKME